MNTVERSVAPEESEVFGGRVARGSGSINVLRDLLRDLRFGIRMLAKSKGFTMAAVLSGARGCKRRHCSVWWMPCC